MFDPPALWAQRAKILKLNRFGAWVWLVLGLASLPVRVVPSIMDRSWGFAIAGGLLSLAMLGLSASYFLILRRCKVWKTPPASFEAMRLTDEGLTIGRFYYPWAAVMSFTITRRPQLVLGLQMGVKPDLPVTVGFEEAEAGKRLMRLFGVRGPRVHPATLAIPLAELDRVLQYYSQGRAMILRSY
ncbi:hypothetical protein OG394_16880 [Kribbella sp. NBC_01245]|uniref:hypothetical protein n=1 Tax=Kribbella sp. NBC_01245 TaxID=2903578 RepID=UPI002E295002|nr:hypothetical protein [Kribbella sp. NBC_01245]